jgi:hypothetical protein
LAFQVFFVAVGVIALWFAIEYALAGSWAVAILLVVASGTLEVVAYVAIRVRATVQSTRE